MMALGLGVPQLLTGVWAIGAPRSFFDDFPGVGPALVGGEPPYNRHLMTDVGAAFLATGVALVVAAVIARRVAVFLALATYLAFALPHVIYHAGHEAVGLSNGENAFNVLLLASGVGLALLLLWFTWRAHDPAVAVADAAHTGATTIEAEVPASHLDPSAIALMNSTSARHQETRT
jgi:hypothetical protein